jgi:hypothetical protein
MQDFNGTQITFDWEQIPHDVDFLAKREIKKYSKHYTVNYKSWKSSVKNRYIIGRVVFVVIKPYVISILVRKKLLKKPLRQAWKRLTVSGKTDRRTTR